MKKVLVQKITIQIKKPKYLLQNSNSLIHINNTQ